MKKPIGKLLWHKAKLLDKSNWQHDRGYIFIIIPFQPTNDWFRIPHYNASDYVAIRALNVIQITLWKKTKNIPLFKAVNGMENIQIDNTRSVSDHICFHYSFVTGDEQFYEAVQDYFASRSKYINIGSVS